MDFSKTSTSNKQNQKLKTVSTDSPLDTAETPDFISVLSQLEPSSPAWSWELYAGNFSKRFSKIVVSC